MSVLVDWNALHGDAFRGARVLVTGGAGFIGSHLDEALLELGATVVAFDDLSAGSPDPTSDFPDHGSRFRFVQGSILDASAIDRAIAGCDFVFHLAALGSVPRSVREPLLYVDVNVRGTANVLESARRAGCRRVAFAASSSAYGDTPTLPKIEDMCPRPRSPYAAAKLAGEALMLAYATCYDVDAISLRYFNIFGPRQRAGNQYAAVIAAFARALMRGEPLVIHGDGEQSRDFTYVANAVQANLLAARSTSRLGGQVVNVGCGQRVTLNELAAVMAEIAIGAPPVIERQPAREGDVKHSLADISAAEKAIGYRPLVDLRRGLVETLRWFRETQ